MAEKSNSNLNLNTLLLTIVLGLCAWTLREVNQHGRELAAVAERVNSAMRISDELSSRIQQVERMINDLTLRR